MIRIVTDSAADFEPQELENLNITCIPLTVSFGEDIYQENINLSKDLFYELLTTSGQAPKTSQAAPHFLLDILEEGKAAGDEVIYITLSSALSGTWQTAMMAKEMAEYDGCSIVDSRSATGGQRLLVEYAARLRDEGCSAAQIVSAVESLRERVVLYACIDTMEYLYRGGRISLTAYKLGSMAQIKPIIHLTTAGSIEVPAKAMGMRKGMDILRRHLTEQEPDPDFPLYVMYTGCCDNAQILAIRLQAMGYDIPAQRIINVGAAIGSHIGPNGCGIVYISK